MSNNDNKTTTFTPSAGATPGAINNAKITSSASRQDAPKQKKHKKGTGREDEGGTHRQGKEQPPRQEKTEEYGQATEEGGT